MRAGDWPLALTAARRLDAANALPPIRRILLAGEALKARNWAEAERQIGTIEQEQTLAQMVPMLKAWRAYGMGAADPGVLLESMAAGPTSTYAVEHRALLQLARGQGDGAAFVALDANSGLRAQHLRLLAAAEFLHRGDQAKALALVGGNQSAMIAARREIEARRPLPGRIDTAAEGFAEFLSRVAIDFSQQRLGSEGVVLARLASYLAPEAAQPLMIAAEIEAEDDPAAAARLLSGVSERSPFARQARDLRVRLLSQSGQRDAALAELRERTGGNSRAPGDWFQLGQLQQERGEHAAAATSYARAHEYWRATPDPATPEWTLVLSKGGALEQSGQWPQARAALREAYRLAPTEPLVLNYLGYAQLDRGEAVEDSEALIREALRLAPNSAAITDSLGWALYRRGQFAESIPILERAVRGEPADVEINEHLGDAYYSAGRRMDARMAWRAALVHAAGPAAERLRRKIDRGLAAAAR
jgi:Flp pilus assembly protein TadD